MPFKNIVGFFFRKVLKNVCDMNYDVHLNIFEFQVLEEFTIFLSKYNLKC